MRNKMGCADLHKLDIDMMRICTMNKHNWCTLTVNTHIYKKCPRCSHCMSLRPLALLSCSQNALSPELVPAEKGEEKGSRGHTPLPCTCQCMEPPPPKPTKEKINMFSISLQIVLATLYRNSLRPTNWDRNTCICPAFSHSSPFPESAKKRLHRCPEQSTCPYPTACMSW